MAITDPLTLLDDFNGHDDGTELADNPSGTIWGADIFNEGLTLGYWSDQCQAQSEGGICSNYWDDVSIGNQRVVVTISDIEAFTLGTVQAGLWIALDPSSQNGYVLRWIYEGGIDDLIIYRSDSGTLTELNSITNFEPHSADLFGFELVDGTLNAYQNDDIVLTTTDFSYDSGVFALENENFESYMDDVYWGDASSSSPSSQTINPGHIASTAALHAPTLDPGSVTINPGHIASTAVLYAPTLSAHQTINPGHIASTVVYAPTLLSRTKIFPALIASTAQVFVPTLDPGSVTIDPGHIASTVIHAPTLVPGDVTINPGHIASTVVHAPTLDPGDVTVDVPHFGPHDVVYRPTLTGGAETDEGPEFDGLPFIPVIPRQPRRK